MSRTVLGNTFPKMCFPKHILGNLFNISLKRRQANSLKGFCIQSVVICQTEVCEENPALRRYTSGQGKKHFSGLSDNYSYSLT